MAEGKGRVTLARTAGFCFGVDRAVKTVYRLAESDGMVCTLGPIIHNPQLIADLGKKGVRIIENPSEAPKGATVVVRSHGVADSVINELKSAGISYENATCPFVENIHKLVREASDRTIIITGDASHAEVEGIVGCAKSPCYVVSGNDELENLLNSHPEFAEKDIMMCSQTTFRVEEWEKCLKTLKKVYTKAFIFDTICNATEKRQTEAVALARENDVMIVVGGRTSSNTAKLRDVCSPYARTYLIETAEELSGIDEDWKNLNIGITAGASTPAIIIKEVLVTMAEIIENFAEMLEESFKNQNTDGSGRVHGVVSEITPTEVRVDIVGRKQTGYITLEELSQDPTVKPEDVCKIGDELDLLIMKTNDQEGMIMLSKRRVDALKGWDELAEAKENGTILTAKVTDVVKGGITVVVSGVRVFIPASLATENRGDDLAELKGKDVSFRMIEVDASGMRRKAVGSVREVLREQRKAQQEKFWEEVEEGQKFTGKVKSITNFGAFVDLGGVDGMVHVSELSWNRIKHPSEVVAIGDTVDVYVKSVDKENRRISLGYKNPDDNPWAILERDYPVGSVCEATIVSMQTFGAFARVIPGIDGLIHISQIADKRIEKPQDELKIGEVVKVKITDIDFEKRRVSLSIRALLEDEQAENAEAYDDIVDEDEAEETAE